MVTCSDPTARISIGNLLVFATIFVIAGRHLHRRSHTRLGCDRQTVNDTLLAYGTALIDDDPCRSGTVEALGLDEVRFVPVGPDTVKNSCPQTA
jgi:hypothetical protein